MMPPPGMPPPNFSVPPPGFGPPGGPGPGGPSEELWVETKTGEGKVRCSHQSFLFLPLDLVPLEARGRAGLAKSSG